MNKAAIRVEQLGKQYQIGGLQEGYKTLRDTLSDSFLSPFRWLSQAAHGRFSANDDQEFWALRDVSFEIERGEVVGIIGRNGSGKSTLLKILSRITVPTTGYADIYGRVGSLLEVGTGFHPELTGRENIYLSGAILGMRRHEIERRFDEIVAFAEIEKFVDTPVKRYSSGMYVRLAFAVAAHMQSEILLVDEVLAVGDIAFQKKCLGKMENAANSGRTIMFVSHNMVTISSLCSRAILLSNGHIVAQGSTDYIISLYMDQVSSLRRLELSDRKDRQGNGRMRVNEIAVKNSSGQPIDKVRLGEDVYFEIAYESSDKLPLRNVEMSLHFYSLSEQPLFNLWNEMVGDTFPVLPPQGRIRCLVPHWPLLPGQYQFNVFCQVNFEIADWVLNAGLLDVVEGDFFGTGRIVSSAHGDVFVLPHSWEVME